MIGMARRYQEALDRAKAHDLESIIRERANDRQPRKATARQIAQRRNLLMRQYCDVSLAQRQLERIIAGNDLTDISYLTQGLIAARSVCRVEIRKDNELIGYGTGFLVAPQVMLTNHHVLEDPDLVRDSIAQFRYERDARGRDVQSVDFRLSITTPPVIYRELDIALVAVEPTSLDGLPLEQFGWLPLSPEPGKAFVGEYLTIIQHPNGDRKQICVRENKLLEYFDNAPWVWYQTDTVSGSSGSPVFNNNWQVIALHHKSIPLTKRVRGEDVPLNQDGKPWGPTQGDDAMAWKANEGVRISAIVRYLQTQQPDNPLSRAVVANNQPPPCDLSVGSIEANEGMRIRRGKDGNTSIVLPVEIGIQVGLQQQIAAAVAAATQPAVPRPRPAGVPMPQTVEAVIINQNNYGQRNGYDPGFLGGGLTVPLPKVVGDKQKKEVLKINGNGGALKYWNYSVVMNKSRKLAFFSAANVDPQQWRGNRDADGDKWYRDTRVDKVDKAAQLGQEFYGKQSKFEADRSKNPFDRGHLTRRRDAQWGHTDTEAKRNGDDSYHFTNCSPQHWQFNQNNEASGIWFRLEESAAKTLSNGKKLCIINGCVFDAPMCKPSSDGLRLNLKAKKVPDGTFGGIKIPKQFFKVIAYNDGGTLRCKAFVVTQEDLLATIDRYYDEAKLTTLTDQEVRLYRASIADLEAVTGLDFGALAEADGATGTDEAIRLSEGLPITSEASLWG